MSRVLLGGKYLVWGNEVNSGNPAIYAMSVKPGWRLSALSCCNTLFTMGSSLSSEFELCSFHVFVSGNGNDAIPLTDGLVYGVKGLLELGKTRIIKFVDFQFVYHGEQFKVVVDFRSRLLFFFGRNPELVRFFISAVDSKLKPYMVKK